MQHTKDSIKTFIIGDGKGNFGRIQTRELPIRVVQTASAVKILETGTVVKDKQCEPWPDDPKSLPVLTFVRRGMFIVGVKGQGIEIVHGKVITSGAGKNTIN